MVNYEYTEAEKILNQAVYPRLQIIGHISEQGGESYQKWDYELVYEHFTEGLVKLVFAKQTRYGGEGDNVYVDKNGLIDPPMRIKADSKWDSIQMNLPLFYIWGNHVERVSLTEFKEKFKDKLNK